MNMIEKRILIYILHFLHSHYAKNVLKTIMLRGVL